MVTTLGEKSKEISAVVDDADEDRQLHRVGATLATFRRNGTPLEYSGWMQIANLRSRPVTYKVGRVVAKATLLSKGDRVQDILAGSEVMQTHAKCTIRKETTDQ